MDMFVNTSATDIKVQKPKVDRWDCAIYFGINNVVYLSREEVSTLFDQLQLHIIADEQEAQIASGKEIEELSSDVTA